MRHMDGFETLLEIELARVLDPIVRTPAPPRSRPWRHGRRGRLRALQGGMPDQSPGPVPAPDVMVAAPVVISVP
jgi:hypothetical protein